MNITNLSLSGSQPSYDVNTNVNQTIIQIRFYYEKNEIDFV